MRRYQFDFRVEDLRDDLSKLTVSQLKDLLKEKGLKVPKGFWFYFWGDVNLWS